ncbi:MAG: maltose phosphorylase [Bacteroidetes bacterium GWF2_49_14]|nr:MAG: maltose phosphorylase [Bacteroidetes bacterium GWF2_49_14]HBB90441.1 family 65 glycosyl hydrolase [Bacteroidales bacterium]
MHRYLLEDEWLIIEDRFDPSCHKKSESLFSLGNGHMGQRANFEETYSGQSLPGNYIAGIYYPDKTRVGWWKNGYPEYFAKVLNAPNWIGFRIMFGQAELDLNTMTVSYFRRTLNMKEGVLYREFEAAWPDGKCVRVETSRFLSMANRELAAIRFMITPLNFNGELVADLFIDGAVTNEDSNYDERFWETMGHSFRGPIGFLQSRTRKSEFDICIGMYSSMTCGNNGKTIPARCYSTRDSVGHHYCQKVNQGEQVILTKLVSVTTSRDYKKLALLDKSEGILASSQAKGFITLRSEHIKVWEEKWKNCDIKIDGDVSAQQGIRFNIFHLNQTYTGHDPRLNIGPKGFTGEKYGGSTYWDTEAFCLPFYLSTTDAKVARNLLLYRHNHLGKAIENAGKLGFTGGAALFPMVTVNGEECHNEWEITFEEIHRNGAIAYAIFNYIRHTGDESYLTDYGLEVLIGISRFWSQRLTYSDEKQAYVMLGVTGPNEYENNVHNNWYTNYIAAWTLSYTMECMETVRAADPRHFSRLLDLTNLNVEAETHKWKTIQENIYYPTNKERGIFLQQDGYLDKEQLCVEDLDPAERPLNQNWSWDRILRSCFIKQADVLQALYFFENHFDTDTVRRNFDFYEPRCVHESSLSPCVHSILASRLGYSQKAYDLYLRTSRLDLDDYNHEVHQGCHITSMAGTWMAVVEGFAGMKVAANQLHFNPVLPEGWTSLSFSVHFRESLYSVNITSDSIIISDRNYRETKIRIGSFEYPIKGEDILKVQL